MHARVGIYSFKPDLFREAVNLMRDQVAPAMRGHGGYKGVYLLTDEPSCRVMSISLWESEDAMHNAEGTGGYFQEALIRLANYFAGTPVVEHYDVGLRS